jgi:hypothetical protein
MMECWGKRLAGKGANGIMKEWTTNMWKNATTDCSVIPAKAGIQWVVCMAPCFRRNDEEERI